MRWYRFYLYHQLVFIGVNADKYSVTLLFETIKLVLLGANDNWFLHTHANVTIPESKVHGTNMGPAGPRWAPWWPHEPCYQGWQILVWYQGPILPERLTPFRAGKWKDIRFFISNAITHPCPDRINGLAKMSLLGTQNHSFSYIHLPKS